MMIVMVTGLCWRWKEGENWVSRKEMGIGRRQFTLTTLDNLPYAIGGLTTNQWNNGTMGTSKMQSYRKGFNRWVDHADYSLPIYRHCTVADHSLKRLWVTGGTYHHNHHGGERSDVRYWDKNSNTWHHPKADSIFHTKDKASFLENFVFVSS